MKDEVAKVIYDNTGNGITMSALCMTLSLEKQKVFEQVLNTLEYYSIVKVLSNDKIIKGVHYDSFTSLEELYKESDNSSDKSIKAEGIMLLVGGLLRFFGRV